MNFIVIHLIKAYQLTFSLLLPPGTCRFEPTCSQYTIDAVSKYGSIKGIWRGMKRILRCHPWHPGGTDPA